MKEEMFKFMFMMKEKIKASCLEKMHQEKMKKDRDETR